MSARNRMISNPESDNVVVDDLFGLLVEQSQISLDEDDEINKLEAELKAKKEAREKNKQTKRFDEITNEINNKIKELPRTDETMALLENISRMIPYEPIVHEPVVHEPVEDVEHVRRAARNPIDRNATLDMLPNKLVLVVGPKKKNQFWVIFNKNDNKFYRYGHNNKTRYDKLSHAHSAFFPNKKANVWSSFRAEERISKKTKSIETLHDDNWLVNNSDRYCDKTFDFPDNVINI